MVKSISRYPTRSSQTKLAHATWGGRIAYDILPCVVPIDVDDRVILILGPLPNHRPGFAGTVRYAGAPLSHGHDESRDSKRSVKSYDMLRSLVRASASLFLLSALLIMSAADDDHFRARFGAFAKNFTRTLG